MAALRPAWQEPCLWYPQNTEKWTKKKCIKIKWKLFYLINCQWRRFSSSVERWKSSKKLNYHKHAIFFFQFAMPKWIQMDVDILQQHSATSAPIYIGTIDPTNQYPAQHCNFNSSAFFYFFICIHFDFAPSIVVAVQASMSLPNEP